MASQALTVKVRIEGGRETLAAFRRLPREATTALSKASLDLARLLAEKVATSARGDSPQSALMAATVKAIRARVPAITAGGTNPVGRNRVPAYKVLFGAEFGATVLPQYRPHLGREGYWMFKTVEDNEATISRAWLKAADDIVRAFGEG